MCLAIALAPQITTSCPHSICPSPTRMLLLQTSRFAFSPIQCYSDTSCFHLHNSSPQQVFYSPYFVGNPTFYPINYQAQQLSSWPNNHADLPNILTRSSKSRRRKTSSRNYEREESNSTASTVSEASPPSTKQQEPSLTDFPAIGSLSLNDSKDPVWPTQAGFRSYKDAILTERSIITTTTIKPEPIEEMAASSNPELTTSSKKKKKSKSSQLEEKRKPHKAKQLTLSSFIVSHIKTPGLSFRKKAALKKSGALSRHPQEGDLPRNILDSSAPSKRRGKQRETPRRPRVTPFKKGILQEKARIRTQLQASRQLIVKRRALQAAIEEESDEGIDIAPTGSLVSTPAKEEEDLEDVEKETSGVPAESEIGQICNRFLHSAKLREYCRQALNDAIDRSASLLITELVRFQDRLHEKDPQKAQIKKRYTCGLREVSKYISIGKVKCLLLAPDIEQVQKNGLLDRTIHNLIDLAKVHGTPVVMALTR